MFFTTFVYILLFILVAQTGQQAVQHINSVDHSEKENERIGVDRKAYPNLLDAHPNAKVMEIIGGNLKPFYKELESLGFVTYQESCSNYPVTILSVASMLYMDYLKAWRERFNIFSPSY